ncbi:MAG: FRG domain-containing protein [Anaerolineales bacterium]|nr:FRG domain-containing protein [Anaerolineales bacterium]
MINKVKNLMAAIQDDLTRWDNRIKPWFRGESNGQRPLCPKIAEYDEKQENYFLQSFRRKAEGLANVPPRQGHTDLWLFLAQHYGVPTRLLDWTEGLLLALYFAINRAEKDPKI